jgi:RNA polymerase sigma factor (sigma-70 family)
LKSADWRRQEARPETIMSVDQSPLTRASLLVQIRDGANHSAWQEFVQLYGPVIYGFARKRGLQDADAADLMQEVLRSVAIHVPKLNYDSSKGTFRGWLYTIARNKIYNFLNGRRRQPRGTGDSAAQQRLEEEPDRNDDPDADWEREYQKRLSARAMELVRDEFQPNTWQAFWQTAVDGRGAQEVAKELKMSPGAVYVAKSRVLARIREEVEALQE